MVPPNAFEHDHVDPSSRSNESLNGDVETCSGLPHCSRGSFRLGYTIVCLPNLFISVHGRPLPSRNERMTVPKIDVNHGQSQKQCRLLHSSPSSITFVLFDKPSLNRATSAANSEGTDAPGCGTLDRCRKENIREEGTKIILRPCHQTATCVTIITHTAVKNSRV